MKWVTGRVHLKDGVRVSPVVEVTPEQEPKEGSGAAWLCQRAFQVREQRGAEELRKATWPEGGGQQRQIPSGHVGFGGGCDALGLP